MAKARFGLLELVFGAAVLVGWTLLGGLDALNGLLLGWIGDAYAGMAQQLSLLVGFVVIGGLIELPFTLYQTFSERTSAHDNTAVVVLYGTS